MARDFVVLYVSGIKYRVRYRQKLCSLIQSDYILKTISREKTSMSIYDFQL